MLLVTVALLQSVLGRQIDLEQRRQAPSFFFLDVQPDQRDAFVRLVTDTAGTAPPSRRSSGAGSPPSTASAVTARWSTADGRAARGARAGGVSRGSTS